MYEHRIAPPTRKAIHGSSRWSSYASSKTKITLMKVLERAKKALLNSKSPTHHQQSDSSTASSAQNSLRGVLRKDDEARHSRRSYLIARLKNSVRSSKQVEERQIRREWEIVDLTAVIEEVLDYIVTEATSDLDAKHLAETDAKGQELSHDNLFDSGPLLSAVVETTIETSTGQGHNSKSLEATEPDEAQVDVETIDIDSSGVPRLFHTPKTMAEEHGFQIEDMAKTDNESVAIAHDASIELSEDKSCSATFQATYDENAFQDSGIFVARDEEAQLDIVEIEKSCGSDYRTTSKTDDEYRALGDRPVLPLIKLSNTGTLPDGRHRAHSLPIFPSTTLFLGQLRLDMQTLSLADKYQGTELDYLIENPPLSAEEEFEDKTNSWSPCDYSEDSVLPFDGGGCNESAGQLIASTSGRSLGREAVTGFEDIRGNAGNEEDPYSASNELAKTRHQEYWNIIVSNFLGNDSTNVWAHRYDPTPIECPGVDEEVEEIFRDQECDYYGSSKESEECEAGRQDGQIDAADEEAAEFSPEYCHSDSYEDCPQTFTMTIPIRPTQDNDPVAMIQAQFGRGSDRSDTGLLPHGYVYAESEKGEGDCSEVWETDDGDSISDLGASQIHEDDSLDLSLNATSKYKQLHWTPEDEKGVASTTKSCQDGDIQTTGPEESRIRKKMWRKAMNHMALTRTLKANETISVSVTAAAISTHSSDETTKLTKWPQGFSTKRLFRGDDREALQKNYKDLCRHLDADDSYDIDPDTDIFGEEGARTKHDEARERIKSRFLGLRKPLVTLSEKPLPQESLAKSAMHPNFRANSAATFDFWDAGRSAQQVEQHQTHGTEAADAPEVLPRPSKERSIEAPQLDRQLAKGARLAERQAITDATLAAWDTERKDKRALKHEHKRQIIVTTDDRSVARSNDQYMGTFATGDSDELIDSAAAFQACALERRAISISSLDNSSAPEATPDRPREQVVYVLDDTRYPGIVRRVLAWSLTTATKVKSWLFLIVKKVVRSAMRKWIRFTDDLAPEDFESSQQINRDRFLDYQETVMRSQETESKAKAVRDLEIKTLQARYAELDVKKNEVEQKLMAEKDRSSALERVNVEMKKTLLERIEGLSADLTQARWKNGLLVAEYYRLQSSPVQEAVDT